MKYLLWNLFSTIIFVATTNAMHNPPPIIDLNEVEEYFRIAIEKANFQRKEVQLPQQFEPHEPDIRTIILSMSQQNVYVPVISVGEHQDHKICTKELTKQFEEIFSKHYKNFHAYDPNFNFTNFFTEAADNLAFAMREHGLLQQ